MDGEGSFTKAVVRFTFTRENIFMITEDIITVMKLSENLSSLIFIT